MIIRHYAPLGSYCDNPGDNIVEVGAMSVIKDDPGIVYLIGTPWFWDQCETSPKYQWLEQQVELYPATQLVAVGIGACLPTGGSLDWLLKPSTIEKCKLLWCKFRKIAVRDTLSQEFLKEIGIESTLLPCPSVFFPISNPPDPGPNSCLFIDAMPWHDGIRLARLEISVPDNSDRLLFSGGHYTMGRLEALLNFCLAYETIVSERIHALLPLARHRKTAVIPVDSRGEAASRLGVPIWPQVPAVTEIDVEKIRGDYERFLSQ